jgi:hypothetical protein
VNEKEDKRKNGEKGKRIRDREEEVKGKKYTEKDRKRKREIK